MNQMTMQVLGLEALYTAFRKRSAERFEPIFREAIALVPGYMLTYPPRVPGQTYVRTGRYGKDWTISTTVQGSTVSAVYENRRPGVRFIAHEPDQAQVHHGRWPTDAMAIERIRPDLTASLKSFIERVHA